MHLETSPNPENDAHLSRYLCPFQVEGVRCRDRYQVTEKANRIGWTWIDALRNILLRLEHKKRDYLFTTQNWNGALEYGRYLEQWLGLFDYGRFLVSRGEEEMTFWRTAADGSQVATQEKVGTYTFDGGSRIILFPSSPWGLQTFEGDVGWDEAAFHAQQKEMWAAIATRLQWGFGVCVWSAHNGVGSWFNQVLLKLAKAPNSGWKTRKVTIYDAIADGLVEKINARSGGSMTREEFLADCKRRALTPEIFAERFECAPSDSGSNIVPWSIMEAAARVSSIVRHHFSQAEVSERFGHAASASTRAAVEARKAKIRAFVRECFGPLFASPAHYRLGYDVAASGEGDLGSFWLAAKEEQRLAQRGLLTTQHEDWHWHEAALDALMELPGVLGCGDKTGLGRQISWTAEQRFPGRFEGVPFTRETKATMGARLMQLLQGGEFLVAAQGEGQVFADVAMDIFGLQKAASGGLTFTATKNPLNAASHGDIAWSAALAAHADATLKGVSGGAFKFSNLRQKIADAIKLPFAASNDPRRLRLPL
jgi:phage FluMu gp28-like protein